MPDGWWRGQDSARLQESGFGSGFGPHLGPCRLGEVPLTWLCRCVDWGHVSCAHLVTCAAGCALVAPGSQLVLWLGPSHTVVLTVQPRKCAPSTRSASRVSPLTVEARASLPSCVYQAGPCRPLLRNPMPLSAHHPARHTVLLSVLPLGPSAPLAPPLVGGPPCSTALHTVGAQSALALLQALVCGTAPRNAPQEPCGQHT